MPMKFTVVILGAPEGSLSSRSALEFCHALLEQNHQIERLFFYADGVHNASSLIAPPQDEADLPASWSQLINEYKLDAVVCIAAALKRGILDHNEQTRYEKNAANLGACFSLSGLGQLIAASSVSDRTITFGS
ncbi:sulfurtransferase complex subunit TusD [Gilvimarinus sp. 2_MG-2023]|uniref:sulfurtransferase complex subunit TusD n=1 Tax=Gilvimarinus sp. 2_MG-2023 TaxID=3062666 RepID=UPI0026E2C527|nr:sulfurtransferase complex subunit TusD [Gilvimarinus sp. 2_MG-2023]